MRSKFAIAMILYVLLGVIAMFILEGKFRWAVLMFIGLLVIKTLIARAAGW